MFKKIWVVRISFEDNGSGVAVARQENSYYPFGMIMPGSYTPTDPNKHLYNAGSEWQDDYDIANYYSTFFREYDPVLGRFNSVDPMAEATVELSIYHYSGNNPVNFNDPSGLIMHVPTSFYGSYFESYMSGDYMDHLTGNAGGLFDAENGGGRGAIEVINDMFYNFQNYGHGFHADFKNGFETNREYLLDWQIKRLCGLAPDQVASFFITSYGSQVSNVSVKAVEGGFNISFTTSSGKSSDLFWSSEFVASYNEYFNFEEDRTWDEKANLFLGAMTTSWSAKERLIDLAIKSSPALEKLKYVKFVKVVGKGLFWVQAGVSTWQAVDAWRSDASLKSKVGTTAKSAIDVTVAYIVLTGGPLGWTIGGVYFIVDATVGWGWLPNGISDKQSKEIWNEINSGKRHSHMLDL